MSAPHSFRRGAGLATTAVLLALLSLTPALPVSALDQAANTIRVTENQTVEKDFPPLASAEPLPGLPSPAPRLNTPDRCRQATYCDTIPLEVVLPPTLKPSDEFFVSVALEWKTQSLPATAYTKPQQLNDLDLYVWEDPQTDMPIQQSSTDAQPEQLRLFRPGKSKYSIVVFNYLGANTGYKLRVTYKPEKIVPPFESLAPDFNPVATPPVPFVAPVEGSQPPAVLPIDTSGQAETPTTAARGEARTTHPGGRQPRPRFHQLRRRRLRPAAGRPDQRRADREAGQGRRPPKARLDQQPDLLAGHRPAPLGGGRRLLAVEKGLRRPQDALSPR
jgi:hypothetical protein